MTHAPVSTRTLLLALVLALVATLLPLEPVSAQEVAPETLSTVLEGVEETLPTEAAAGTGESRIGDVLESPMPFVGLGVKGSGPQPELRVRARHLDGTWGEWLEVGMLDGADGPDPDTLEGARYERSHAELWTSDAVWVGPADALVLEVTGETPTDLEVTVIDTAGLSESWLERTSRTLRSLTTTAPAQAADGAPEIITRAQWGADESLRSGSPSYRDISHGVIHHTVTKNNYTREEAAQQVRNMYHWHTKGNGWSDLGYNFVVDRFGRIYEGRYGGIDRGVRGAHARGWNSTSFGVAVMGNYNDVDPTQASLDAAAELFAWKYSVHGIDPDPTARVYVNDSHIRTLEGHRNVRGNYIEWTSDTGFQYDCPGFNIAWRLPILRDAILEVYEANAYGAVESAEPEPEPIVFSDVSNSQFVEEINWLVSEGIAEGYPDGTFRPTHLVTRQAAAAFLWRLAGEPPVDSQNRFSDVPADHTFSDAITWAERSGITEGWPDGTFRPNEPVRRQAAMAFLHRFAGSPDSAGDPGFTDVDADHDFHAAIAWGAGAGLTKGYDDGTFQPTREVARQAIAAFVHELRTNGHG